jgi:hypothetical protein
VRERERERERRVDENINNFLIFLLHDKFDWVRVIMENGHGASCLLFVGVRVRVRGESKGTKVSATLQRYE